MKNILKFFALLLSVSFIAASQIHAQTGGTYDLSHNVIASGGGSNSTGGTFSLDGTIGQAIAGTVSTGTSGGTQYNLSGGFWTTDQQPLAPTAASVTVSGRVITSAGKGIRNVLVTMTDSSGTARTVFSTSFGRFSFTDVSAGETYIFSVRAKRFTFGQNAQVFSINEDVDDILFVGDPIWK
ncbi:MAG: carboxypeptidase regulatory-like domain-containing protein [Acidobacteriota bacterium]|nr:carboxypeptidase regulatory-like domain-containing protein [Acidobacteriota bacterium]